MVVVKDKKDKNVELGTRCSELSSWKLEIYIKVRSLIRCDWPNRHFPSLELCLFAE